jgi:hypothetical protein
LAAQLKSKIAFFIRPNCPFVATSHNSIAQNAITKRKEEMRLDDTGRKERLITDSYSPFNILAVNQDDDRVILSVQDFEKLLMCRDVVLFALHSKRDVPYSLVEKVTASFR